jgi:hypothetical protein
MTFVAFRAVFPISPPIFQRLSRVGWGNGGIVQLNNGMVNYSNYSVGRYYILKPFKILANQTQKSSAGRFVKITQVRFVLDLNPYIKCEDHQPEV